MNLDNRSTEQTENTSTDSNQWDAPTATTADFTTAVPGEPVTIADGPWFLRADFDRAGPDLHLTGPEGQELVIRDYFNQVSAPDLITADGIVLNGHVATQLAGPIAPEQYAQAISSRHV